MQIISTCEISNLKIKPMTFQLIHIFTYILRYHENYPS